MTGEAIALTNLGLVYLRQGRYQRAASQLKRGHPPCTASSGTGSARPPR